MTCSQTQGGIAGENARPPRSCPDAQLTLPLLSPSLRFDHSFCFRNLSDFSFKMAAYSHADRLFGNANWQSFLDPKRIQRLVCEGKDLFDMVSRRESRPLPPTTF